MDDEFNKLARKDTFDFESVQPWKSVRNRARATGKTVHIGLVFGLCVEKGSELPKGAKQRKYKGRLMKIREATMILWAQMKVKLILLTHRW